MSADKVLRSKGAAKQPTKIPVVGAIVKRSSFQDTLDTILSSESCEEIATLIDSLACNLDLKQQIGLIDKFKVRFLKSVPDSRSPNVKLLEIKILVKLYLHPDYSLLRKSLEWIVEVVCTDTIIKPTALKKALLEVSLGLALSVEAADFSVLADIEKASSWAIAITCIAMFDKEYYFLDSYSVYEEHENDAPQGSSKVTQLDDVSPLLHFLTVPAKMFDKFSEIVSAQTADSSAEVMRYAECCGECMRAMMTSLKSRRGAYVGKDNSNKWMSLVDSTISSGLTILRSDLVHKDTVTATAMSIVCLQWICRHHLQGKSGSIVPGMQLVNILQMLSIPSDDKSESHLTVQSDAHEEGVHFLLRGQLTNLPIISRCAVLRACLTVFDDSSLANTSHSGVEQLAELSLTSVLLGPAFAAVIAACSHSLPLVRLYGLQTLETWFNRLDDFITLQSSINVSVTDNAIDVQAAMLMPLMRTVSDLLVTTWSHPSKQVNHMVPTVYQRLISTLHALTAGHRAAGRHQAVVDVWQPFISEALSLPAQQRARYQAMTMLIPCVGGRQIILAQPDVFEALVQAVKLRDVASSSCSVIVALLRDLTQVPHSDSESTNTLHGDSMSGLRSLWAKSVAAAVTSRDLKTRTNSADYLIPELLKIDSTSGPHLLQEIRSIFPVESFSIGDASYAAMLWGLVQVTLHSKALALSSVESNKVECESQSSAELSDEEVIWACLSDDVDLRLASLTLITASQRTSAPLLDSDLSILRRTLKYSLKTTGADQRQRLTRIVKAIVFRVSESHRMNERNVSRLQKRAAVLSRDLIVALSSEDHLKATDIQAKLSQGDIEIAQGGVIAMKAPEVLEWLCEELFDNIYPGTVFEREVTALELLHCAVDSIGDNSSLKGIFFSSAMTKTALNLLLSSWDKSRKLSADFLFKFPRPLPCYTTPIELIPLMDRGCLLAGSARQRESDAGALLLRTMFVIYSMSLAWPCSTVRDTSKVLKLTYAPTGQASVTQTGSPSKESVTAACVSFIDCLCDLLGDRLGNLESLFLSFSDGSHLIPQGEGEEGGEGGRVNVDKAVVSESSGSDGAELAPLCHGLLLAIRYCMKELHTSDLIGNRTKKDKEHSHANTPNSCEGNVWRAVVNRVLSLSLDALRVALLVVAEAPCDVQFAPTPTAKMRGEFALLDGQPAEATCEIAAKGPVNSSSILTASYVNTNSLMGATSGADSEGQGQGQGQQSMQRAVVAAWLLVKEAAAMLALLVEVSPPPLHIDAVGPSDLLSVRDISNVGAVILDALGRLKHMGAIAETHAALQAIAETLFKHGERSVELCRLPSLWLRQLLDRLGSEQQVFILRRSAGFAYSFVSLLRSEPSNCKVTLLPLAMRVLLKHIEKGLDDIPLTGARTGATDRKEEIENESGADGALDVSLERGGSWRISVHALNVIRMILIDAALSPDLDTFIAESTELAVRGFQSRNWAVRNSSMMVFSSVVQRAVDNDKNESGGARAATAVDFFQRFPSLFIFLLRELGSITGHTIGCKDTWPETVSNVSTESEIVSDLEDLKARGSHEGGLHPSLFPILLLLSKMRPASEEVSTELIEGRTHRQADISLFVPLVESCRGQYSQKVREMAAKALCPLIPLRAVPRKAAALLDGFNRNITAYNSSSKEPSSASPTLSHNQLHGTLCLCYEVLDSLRRRMAGVGDNKAALSQLQEEVADVLLPQVAETLSLLSPLGCPSLHIVFLRIVRTCCILLASENSVSSSGIHGTGEIQSLHIAEALCLGECRVSLRPVLGHGHGHGSATGLCGVEDIGLQLPYAPVLYREALLDLTFFSIVQSSRATPSESQLMQDNPFSTYPVQLLLQLLSHPISEVREGVLLGCQRALTMVLSGATTLSSTNKDALCSYLLFDTSILERLIDLIGLETQPPLRQIALQVMCSITRLSPLSRHSESTATSFKDKWALFMFIAMSDSISHAALQIASSLGSAMTGSTVDEKEVCLASTEAAALALEVMGWVMASSLAPISVTDGLAPISAAQSGGADWIVLLEDGADEDRSAAAREAAARSLAASGLLPWARSHAERTELMNASEGTVVCCDITKEWATLAVRAWLVALKLMQDDDEETRALISSAIAAVGWSENSTSRSQTGLMSTEGLNEGTAISRGVMPSYVSAVQGCVLDRMGALLSQAIVWSIRESGNILISSSDPIAGLDGLRVVLDELSTLSGSRKDAMDALVSDDDSQYDKIFEAEQANLHAEPLVAAKVLSTALALTCLHLAGTTTDTGTAGAVSEWMRSHAVMNLVDAISLLRGSGAAQSDWVGGCTYQKEVFTYLSSALQSSLAIETLFREHKNFNTVCGEIPSQLFSFQARDSDADVEGSRSHIRVISEGHPIIKKAYEEFCAIVI